jgi:hypothetical protein
MNDFPLNPGGFAYTRPPDWRESDRPLKRDADARTDTNRYKIDRLLASDCRSALRAVGGSTVATLASAWKNVELRRLARVATAKRQQSGGLSDCRSALRAVGGSTVATLASAWKNVDLRRLARVATAKRQQSGGLSDCRSALRAVSGSTVATLVRARKNVNLHRLARVATAKRQQSGGLSDCRSALRAVGRVNRGYARQRVEKRESPPSGHGSDGEAPTIRRIERLSLGSPSRQRVNPWLRSSERGKTWNSAV